MSQLLNKHYRLKIKTGLSWLIVLLFYLIFPCAFLFKHYSIDHLSIVILSGILFLGTSLFLWQVRYTRVIAILLASALVINLCLSIVSEFAYQMEFNHSLALVFLITSPKEAIEMSRANFFIFPVFLIILSILIYAIACISKTIRPKKLAICAACLILLLPVYFISALKKGEKTQTWHTAFSENGISSYALQRVLSRSPFYNVAPFLYAAQNLDIIDKIKKMPAPVYQLTMQETGIDTYVVVIGESVRPDHMQLYGYNRQNTPHQNEQKENMLLFKNAIAPGPYTALAVPLSLSSVSVAHHPIQQYPDNIVNVANQVGIQTHWYSTQGSWEIYDSPEAIISFHARQKKWVEKAYDEELLPLLDTALAEKGKKIIFLHIMGSHVNACGRFPERFEHFSGNNKEVDCYDNSIFYTDYVLNEIMNRLKTKKASLLYYSDHATDYDPNSTITYPYRHGIFPASQSMLKVPMFLWYSPVLSQGQKKTGAISHPYPTEDNYYLIADWLGIRLKDAPCQSALQTCYQAQENIMVVGGKNQTPVEFKTLPQTLYP